MASVAQAAKRVPFGKPFSERTLSLNLTEHTLRLKQNRLIHRIPKASSHHVVQHIHKLKVPVIFNDIMDTFGWFGEQKWKKPSYFGETYGNAMVPMVLSGYHIMNNHAYNSMHLKYRNE